MVESEVDSMTGIPIHHTPVLIIGSSMVGLTLSVLLAKHGVRNALTVEKHASTAIHPRAAYFHPRTMEIMHEMGVYDAMRAESALYYDTNAGLYDVESLAGEHIKTYLANVNEGIEGVSPVSRTFLTQHMLEPILRREAEACGVDLRFSTELVAFRQDEGEDGEGGVVAIIRSTETGEKKIVRARYMVACDGSHSSVRPRIGVEMKGHGLLSRSLTIYFKADVQRFIEGKYNGVIYVNNPIVRGFFRIDKEGKSGFLVVNTAGPQGTEESRFPADTIDEQKAVELLRAAIGADVDIEVEHIAKWQAVCDIATAYSKGRIILAGDACHQNPPHGGFGGNTGIQDAYNLAWKLSLVLANKAGPDLVERTYQDERLPVGKKTVDQVFARYVSRTAPELAVTSPELEQEVPEPWLELGYRYHSAALTTTELGDIVEDPRRATARAGSQAPHVFVRAEGKDDLPIRNLFRGRYTFLLGTEASAWKAAVRALAADESLPALDVHEIDSNAFHARYAVSARGAVLVRPDKFVAWRDWQGPAADVDAEALLRDVFVKILCLAPHGRKDLVAQQATPVSAEKPALTSLSSALHARQAVLKRQKEAMLRDVERLEAEIADLKRMDDLQNEMALLALKLMPASKPAQYSYGDCLQKKADERVKRNDRGTMN